MKKSTDITNKEINYIENQINELNKTKIERNRFIFVFVNIVYLDRKIF